MGSIAVENVESEGSIAAPAKLMPRLAEGVPRAAAHHRRERHQLGDPHQLEERLALHSRRQPRELPAVPTLSAEKKELRFDPETLAGGINKTIFSPRRTTSCAR